MSSTKSIVKTINHYKRSLEASDVDEPRILYCINTLFKLPVTVNILQETGVGRTVNGLCKSEAGDVRLAAKSLVNKWKALVANESSTEEELARQSQEEIDEAKKQNSHGQTRKDSGKIRKERDHRSHHHHHHNSSSSRKDREERTEDKHKSRRSSENMTFTSPLDVPKPVEKYEPQSSHAVSSGSTSKYTPGDTSTSSEAHRDRRSNGEKRSREKDRRHSDKEKSASKRHRHDDSGSAKQPEETKDDDLEIDNSAGTSFADALAMMDGPTLPQKTMAKSVTKTPIPNSSSSDGVKTKGSSSSIKPSYRPSSSSTSYSSSANKSINPKATSSTSFSKSSRPKDSGSGPPPNLLAPSFKLAPLLDPEELKKDLMGTSSAPIVISNSYTPINFLNPTNIAQVSAAISKNKRATGGAAASAETFEILQSKARTKVYSGNKCVQSVLSLHEMCIRVLQKNVDALEFTGGVPYDILEPVLLKCNANQLANIEYYNAYLMEDTNELWKTHAQRQFRGKKPREMETWREMYERCQQEEQDRLSNLTESIKHSQQKSIPVKQTKLAYVDRQAPHQGRRRGWGASGGATSSAPSLNASLSGRTAVNGTRMGFLTAGREVQAKRAPLMQKTLALMKKSIKR